MYLACREGPFGSARVLVGAPAALDIAWRRRGCKKEAAGLLGIGGLCRSRRLGGLRRLGRGGLGLGRRLDRGRFGDGRLRLGGFGWLRVGGGRCGLGFRRTGRCGLLGRLGGFRGLGRGVAIAFGKVVLLQQVLLGHRFVGDAGLAKDQVDNLFLVDRGPRLGLGVGVLA